MGAPMILPDDKKVLGRQCYVRRTGINRHGMVEFDFSIGDPELYVEMILPEAAFREFCDNNHVRFLTEEQGAALDADREKWRGGSIQADGQRGPSSQPRSK